MSQFQTLQGTGRLHRGHRTLGCVGYTLQRVQGPATLVRFDPMPDAAPGDVFHLTLEDGRVLECQIASDQDSYCAVLDGPRTERRRRPAPGYRAFL